MTPPSPARDQAGFTLIEVMVAILLMALISVISWRGLDSITRASNRISETSANATSLTNVMKQFERDIVLQAATAVSQQTGIGGKQLSAISPSRPSSAITPALSVERQARAPFRVEIIRTVAGTPGAWQRVAWWQEGTQLYRASGAGASRFPLPPPNAGEAVLVLENVSLFEVQGWRTNQGWVRLPPPQSNTPISGLELKIVQRMGQDETGYRKVIVLE